MNQGHFSHGLEKPGPPLFLDPTVHAPPNPPELTRGLWARPTLGQTHSLCPLPAFCPHSLPSVMVEAAPAGLRQSGKWAVRGGNTTQGGWLRTPCPVPDPPTRPDLWLLLPSGYLEHRGNTVVEVGGSSRRERTTLLTRAPASQDEVSPFHWEPLAPKLTRC